MGIDVVEHPVAQPAHGRIERGIAGDDDDLDVGVVALDVLHHLDPGHAGHAQIERDDVDRMRVEDVERLLAPRRGVDLVLGLEDHPQRFGWSSFVVDDEQRSPIVHRRTSPDAVRSGTAPRVPRFGPCSAVLS